MMLARLRLKLGENEIEIDSRDFYVDNDTIGSVIGELSHCIPKQKAEAVYTASPVVGQPEGEGGVEGPTPPQKPLVYLRRQGLEQLEYTAPYEPSFDDNIYTLSRSEIRGKLLVLQEKYMLFDSPRTVSETVQHLWKNGWHAGSLDVSKTLVEMAVTGEITRYSSEGRTMYVSLAIAAV